jgi:hypothetical protein
MGYQTIDAPAQLPGLRPLPPPGKPISTRPLAFIRLWFLLQRFATLTASSALGFFIGMV